MLSAGNRRSSDIKNRYFERHTSTEREAFSLFSNIPGQKLPKQICILLSVFTVIGTIYVTKCKTTVQECKKSSSVDFVDLCYSKNTDTAFGYDNMMPVSF